MTAGMYKNRIDNYQSQQTYIQKSIHKYFIIHYKNINTLRLNKMTRHTHTHIFIQRYKDMLLINVGDFDYVKSKNTVLMFMININYKMCSLINKWHLYIIYTQYMMYITYMYKKFNIYILWHNP